MLGRLDMVIRFADTTMDLFGDFENVSRQEEVIAQVLLLYL